VDQRVIRAQILSIPSDLTSHRRVSRRIEEELGVLAICTYTHNRRGCYPCTDSLSIRVRIRLSASSLMPERVCRTANRAHPRMALRLRLYGKKEITLRRYAVMPFACAVCGQTFVRRNIERGRRSSAIVNVARCKKS
jgi:hypothetical protein